MVRRQPRANSIARRVAQGNTGLGHCGSDESVGTTATVFGQRNIYFNSSPPARPDQKKTYRIDAFVLSERDRHTLSDARPGVSPTVFDEKCADVAAATYFPRSKPICGRDDPRRTTRQALCCTISWTKRPRTYPTPPLINATYNRISHVKTPASVASRAVTKLSIRYILQLLQQPGIRWPIIQVARRSHKAAVE